MLLLATLLATLAAPGCQRDTVEVTEPPTVALPDSDGAAPELPPDSLYGATAAEIVRVVPVEVEVPDLPAGWDGARIAAFGDFQLGLWPDNERVATAAVQRAIDSRADVFVLLGDYVGRGDDFGALERVLAPLRGQPTLAVLGDRDLRTDSIQAQATRVLAGLGATILRNGRAPLVRAGDTVYVAGLGPEFALLPDWQQAEIAASLGGAPKTPLLLTHLPALAQTLPRNRFPLVLAGHTFCGQVDVPGTPRLATLATETLGVPGASGRNRLFRLKGNPLLVSCGLGYSFVPVRLGAPPELLLVTLRRAATEEPDRAERTNTDSLPSRPPSPDTMQAAGE